MIKAAKIAAAPLWALQLFSGAKSFRANGLIGSRTLNRMGLHVARKLAAHGLTGTRRWVLSPLVPAELRAAFRLHGYVTIPDFLPAETFDALRAAPDPGGRHQDPIGAGGRRGAGRGAEPETLHP